MYILILRLLPLAKTTPISGVRCAFHGSSSGKSFYTVGFSRPFRLRFEDSKD